MKNQTKNKKKHNKIKKKQNLRSILGNLLILFGTFLIGFVIIINAKDLIESEQAIDTFKTTKLLTETIPSENVSESDEEEDIQEISTQDKIELSQLIGLMRIPKIDLEEAIREGSTSSVLSSALGHMEHTAMPGQPGNCCVAGHRNYTFGKYFNRLNEITIGDRIEIETYDANYEYEVYDVFVIEPTQVEILNSLEGENLTLITCTPLFIGSHRLIIRAKLV